MMPMPLLQDALVTLVALVAAVVLFRRVAGFARPSDATPGCDNCPSAAASCQESQPVQAPAHSEHPLVFIRPSR